jgi:hypothetical protein
LFDESRRRRGLWPAKGIGQASFEWFLMPAAFQLCQSMETLFEAASPPSGFLISMMLL